MEVWMMEKSIRRYTNRFLVQVIELRPNGSGMMTDYLEGLKTLTNAVSVNELRQSLLQTVLLEYNQNSTDTQYVTDRQA
jgi:hypothetical protein